MRSRNKRIAVTLGDPFGIGPEVAVQAITDLKPNAKTKYLLIGDYEVFKFYGGRLTPCVEFLHFSLDIDFKKNIGKQSRAGGQASLAYLNKAVELIRAKEADALVTAPLSKEAVALSSPKFQGHTEFLADAFGIKDVEMMFVTEELKSVIVTRHIALKQVVSDLSPAKIFSAIDLTHKALRELFKIKSPRLGVCGVNPHAGEGGLLGNEDMQKVLPAIKKALKLRMNVLGPLSADTAFTAHARRHYDAIIAMYHDQGLAPIKALYFNQLVNLTIGLPFIRTSPAHGTAFDIAGKNKADPSSMREALNLAVKLS